MQSGYFIGQQNIRTFTFSFIPPKTKRKRVCFSLIEVNKSILVCVNAAHKNVMKSMKYGKKKGQNYAKNTHRKIVVRY